MLKHDAPCSILNIDVQYHACRLRYSWQIVHGTINSQADLIKTQLVSLPVNVVPNRIVTTYTITLLNDLSLFCLCYRNECFRCSSSVAMVEYKYAYVANKNRQQSILT